MSLCWKQQTGDYKYISWSQCEDSRYGKIWICLKVIYNSKMTLMRGYLIEALHFYYTANPWKLFTSIDKPAESPKAVYWKPLLFYIDWYATVKLVAEKDY